MTCNLQSLIKNFKRKILFSQVLLELKNFNRNFKIKKKVIFRKILKCETLNVHFIHFIIFLDMY